MDPRKDVAAADQAEIDEAVREWESGVVRQMEFLGRLFALLRADNIAAVVAGVPERWRADFVEDLRQAAQHDEHDDSAPFIVEEGAYPWGRSEEERAEDRRRSTDAARERTARFREHLLPALRAWVAAQETPQ